MSALIQARQSSPSSYSEAEFSGLSDREAVPKPKKRIRAKKNPVKGTTQSKAEPGEVPGRQTTTATREKNPKDAELENSVFGKKTSWVEKLVEDPFGLDTRVDGVTGKKLVLPWDKDEDDGEVEDEEEVADSNLFTFDNSRPTTTSAAPVDPVQESATKNPDGAVWYDSDDDRITISLASKNMLKRLRRFEGEDKITGREYTVRLGEQYDILHAEPKWASEAKVRALAQRMAEDNGEVPSKRRRRPSSAVSDDVSSSNDEEADMAPLPLSAFLRDIRSIQPTTAKGRSLKPESLNIQRSRDMADKHSEFVCSLQFHPSIPTILLSASRSSLLRLHKIDPAAHPIPNPTITTVQVARTCLRRASFAGANGDSIFMAGRRRFMHNWNLVTGNVQKTTKVTGDITKLEHRSFEHFRASPCGRYVAILGSGRKGGGMISILSANSMMWSAEAKMDSRGGIADFVWWRNGEGLTVLGRDGSIGEYSMRYQMFAAAWTDKGNIGGTVLALGGSSGPHLLGTDRWLAIGDKTGFVHIYDRNTLFSKVAKGDGDMVVQVQNGGHPTPLRRMENIRTRITTLEFSPDGQLLVMASIEQKDALKVAHLPSCTYYRNWPTENTPLGRVTAVAISKERVMVVGNDVGKIRAFEIMG